MNSDTCTNCGYAARRKNPDCGEHPTPELGLDFYKQIGRESPIIERQVHPDDKIILTGKEYLEALERSKAGGAREAEQRGVAWCVGVIDSLHDADPNGSGTDRLFKGIKNTLRDRYKSIGGVDPAPSYPARVELTASEGEEL
jgi:hypothetical protein